VGGQELRATLSMTEAIDALEEAFAAEDRAVSPPRSHLTTRHGELLLMPASSAIGAGVKLVTLNASNPGRGLPLIHAVYVLFAGETLEPLAVIDGGALTEIRTAAVSGLATRHLANPDASRLAIFGAGVQANGHLDAMCVVRPISEVQVVSRSADRAEALAERARSMGVRASTGSADTAPWADIVCTCTTSPEPVFDGSSLQEGAHMNAVGAYTPDARELDERAIQRGRVVVETREAALAEAGDLLIAIANGAFSADRIAADLSEVVRGKAVRLSPGDITIFKSVGVAFEDLAVARAAFDRLRR
jgi:ornithine cyclodeaminase